ncbi:hypothetical protein BC834DRAFT_893536 [Gloeopeniophorella convolvens]|nr:hypothetical protein BC834DRAFT_893536 [Gloeopeniophorella convolvens]
MLRDSPPFPIRIRFWLRTKEWDLACLEDALLSLGHLDRATGVWIRAPRALLKRLLTAMSKPAPRLETLHLECAYQRKADEDRIAWYKIPSGPFPFSGSRRLCDIRFINVHPLAIPPTSVVEFSLIFPHAWDLKNPWSDKLFECLRSMPQLEYLTLILGCNNLSDSRDDLQPWSGPRTCLPDLFRIKFAGNTRSLEAFLSRFDAPCLGEFLVELWDAVDVDEDAFPSLSRFIDRSGRLKTTTAHLGLLDELIYIYTCPSLPGRGTARFRVKLPEGGAWCTSTATVLTRALSPILAGVETLNIGFNNVNRSSDSRWGRIGQANPESWRAALAGFKAVTTLKIDGQFTECILRALKEEESPGVVVCPEIAELLFLTSADPSSEHYVLLPPQFICNSIERRSAENEDASGSKLVKVSGRILDENDWINRHDDDNNLERDERSRPPGGVRS